MVNGSLTIISRFTEDEVDDLINALLDFPDHFFSFPHIKNMRMHKTTGKSKFGFLAVAGEEGILFYQPWSVLSRSYRQYAVFHELSHTFAERKGKERYKSISQNSKWLDLSWVYNRAKFIYVPIPNACFVSKYASVMPPEDLAESFAAYRYDGASFKQNCPQKYDFLKSSVFNGIEYDDEFCN